jgi:hypothetical protein
MATCSLLLITGYQLVVLVAVSKLLLDFVRARRAAHVRKMHLRAAQFLAEARVDQMTRQTIAQMRDAARSDSRDRFEGGGRS